MGQRDAPVCTSQEWGSALLELTFWGQVRVKLWIHNDLTYLLSGYGGEANGVGGH